MIVIAPERRSASSRNTHYTYYSDGELNQKWLANGKFVSYTYDAIGGLSKVKYGGEIMEMPREAYLQRITTQAGAEQAFRTAFSSLKPIDGVYVGMCPRVKDEIKENTALVARILTT